MIDIPANQTFPRVAPFGRGGERNRFPGGKFRSRRGSSFSVFLAGVCIALFFGSIDRQLFAAADSLAVQSTDSTDYYRKQYRGKKTWEHIVSLPGTILSIPFIVVFKAQEALIGYTYEKKLIPKIKSLATSDDGKRGIAPKFSNRTGYGVKLYQEQILSNTDDLSFTITGNIFRGRERYRLRWQNIQIANSPFYTSFLGGYHYLPDERFFGIGPDTKKSDKSFYSYENTVFEAGIDIHTSSSFMINTLFRYDYDNVYGGDEEPSVTENYDKETLPGLQTRIRLAQAGAGFTLDTRNRRGNPSAGQELIFGGTVFKDAGDGPFNFWKIQGDYRQYINFGLNRVLALRFGFEMTDIFDSGDEIPFYYLSQLGISTSIRGYDRGRFRDRDMVLGSVEYRIPIWRSIDFTMFTDAGEVANDLFSDFRFGKLRFGFGTGVRLYSSKDLVANIQLAFSREKIRFLVDLN